MGGQLSVVEICAGAGGQSLGLEKAGFAHTLAIELDETAASTLKLNRPQWEVRVGDVADSSVWNPADYAPTSERPAVSLLAGGVPCPPFSIAGQQLGSSDERDLFAWAVEQVAVMKPEAVLLENVRGLSMPRFSAYRQRVLDRFSEMGYHAEWRLLNSSDFGVAQLRPRFVLIAMRPEDFSYFHWPEPTGARITVGSALKSLMAQNGWEGASAWAKKANDIGPTIVGGSKKHGGADLGPTRAKIKWAELGVDGKGIANHPPMPGDEFEVGPRLTLEMVARLQGWGSRQYEWEFAGKKTSIYRQIGNAFPPPVAHALGTAIADALQHRELNESFSEDRVIADPVYQVLRSSEKPLTYEQINLATGMNLATHELDVRLSLLARDFELDRLHETNGWKFQLGAFKGFVGQNDHVRHEFYDTQRQKVS